MIAMNADKIRIRITIYISFKYYMWYQRKFLYVDISSKLDFFTTFLSVWTDNCGCVIGNRRKFSPRYFSISPRFIGKSRRRVLRSGDVRGKWKDKERKYRLISRTVAVEERDERR